MSNPDFNPLPLQAQISRLVAEVQRQDHAFSMNFGEHGLYLMADERLQSDGSVMSPIQFIAENLSGASLPFSLSFRPGPGSALELSIGGIPVEVGDPDSIGSALKDLDFINEIVGYMPQDEGEAYVVGREGRMNSNQRIATIRARTEIETALKVMAILSPGMADDPQGAIDMDVQQGGSLEMRTLHDWRKCNIEDLVEQARDEIRISLENEEPDFS